MLHFSNDNLNKLLLLPLIALTFNLTMLLTLLDLKTTYRFQGFYMYASILCILTIAINAAMVLALYLNQRNLDTVLQNKCLRELLAHMLTWCSIFLTIATTALLCALLTSYFAGISLVVFLLVFVLFHKLLGK